MLHKNFTRSGGAVRERRMGDGAAGAGSPGAMNGVSKINRAGAVTNGLVNSYINRRWIWFPYFGVSRGRGKSGAREKRNGKQTGVVA